MYNFHMSTSLSALSMSWDILLSVYVIIKRSLILYIHNISIDTLLSQFITEHK
jgi:Co/Zn/Cd efflux system component